MKILRPIVILLLLPVFSSAQQTGVPGSAAPDLGPAMPEWVQRHHTVSEKLRSIYFLIASRRDTFDVQGLSPGAVDSLQYLYTNSDSSLYELNHLVNDPDSGWIKYQVNYYFYDALGRDTTTVIQTLDDQQLNYNNTSKITYMYDANGNVTLNTFFNWDSTYWENSAQFVNSFDANNNLLSTTILNWIGTQWDSVNQFAYAYDTSNNLVEETDYYYSAGFQPSYKYALVYNSANLQIQNTGQYWTGSAWKNQFLDTLEYDVNNNLIYFERKDWKQSSQAFSLTDAKTEYEYNSDNQLILRTDYNGDGATSYTPAAKYTFEFDSNGNNTYQLQQLYSSASSAFVNYNQYFYYYTDVLSGVAALPSNAYKAKFYPNPANSTLQLSMTMSHSSQVQVQVIDISGKLVSEMAYSLLAGSNTIKIDVFNLNAGIYSVRILNPVTKAQAINKFVKM
jgi:hypothetical protein